MSSLSNTCSTRHQTTRSIASALLLLIFTICVVWGAEEEQKHDVESDHESILGSKAASEDFKNLSPEQAKDRLGKIVEKMDVNKDSFVDKEELKNWIYAALISLDEEKSNHSLANNDENKDSKVSWLEYVHRNYGYTEQELADFLKAPSEDMKEFAETIEQEKIKFDLADLNKDGLLDLHEYAAYEHPHKYRHMATFEVPRMMRSFDHNNDGGVDFKEFAGNATTEESLLTDEKQHFEGLDKNKDGKIDLTEAYEWLMIDNSSPAQLEAEYLLRKTDKNKDSKLDKEEILKEVELWVGSRNSDFASHIEEDFDEHRDEL